MTDTVEQLFNYAMEKNFHPHLDTLEHKHYAHEEEGIEKSIQALLPPDRAELLTELRQSRNNSSFLELKAAFQAGLSIGQELSRV